MLLDIAEASSRAVGGERARQGIACTDACSYARAGSRRRIPPAARQCAWWVALQQYPSRSIVAQSASNVVNNDMPPSLRSRTGDSRGLYAAA
ncbi:hypothetical protein HaLaN_09406 [Haematococcus lacustris]|uniref:Uncharacterized protein n=1 Tax=Haematococcus lacustris TaxID=44745 RepID=A0A699YTG6_HAELA|nr:hypothetical protein HaLaN_09406 [Haematococcus lacustris]